MKKKPIEQPTPTIVSDKPDHIMIIMVIAIMLFCIISLAYSIYLISPYETNTKIIKVKYVSENALSIVDECNHPTVYSRSLSDSHINISDVYQINIGTSSIGNEIKQIKLVEKEKYIKNCNSI